MDYLLVYVVVACVVGIDLATRLHSKRFRAFLMGFMWPLAFAGVLSEYIEKA